MALLLFLPNLLWQIDHDWPSLEFYRNADLYKNVRHAAARWGSDQQVLTMNPARCRCGWLGWLLPALAGRER